MNLRQTYIQLEIAFWIFLIQLMCESPFVQDVMRWAHNLGQSQRWLWRLPPTLLWLSAGLSLGFLIGLVGAWLT